MESENEETLPIVWKKIKNYDKYMISSKGEVKNSRDQILKLQKNSGYYQVCLQTRKIRRNFLVHRLVAEAFIENPENKPVVNHKNCKRDENDEKNLEWCTHKENSKHSAENHEVSVNTIRPILQYNDNNEIINTYSSIAEAKRHFNSTSGNISNALKLNIKAFGFFGGIQMKLEQTKRKIVYIYLFQTIALTKSVKLERFIANLPINT
jgi:hypothetical protein